MRQDVFLETLLEHNFNISTACLAAGISRGTFYNWQKKKRFAERLNEIAEAKGDLVEAALLENAVKYQDTIAQIFYCKTKLKHRGYIEGTPERLKQKTDRQTIELLSKLITGETDVRTTALEFSKAGIPLPDTLEILLKKEPVNDDDGTEFDGVLSDEELEERGRKAKEAHERQLSDFRPERQADVEKIKEELKDRDSFSDENTTEEKR
jgi:hypothetical protein